MWNEYKMEFKLVGCAGSIDISTSLVFCSMAVARIFRKIHALSHFTTNCLTFEKIITCICSSVQKKCLML